MRHRGGKGRRGQGKKSVTPAPEEGSVRLQSARGPASGDKGRKEKGKQKEEVKRFREKIIKEKWQDRNQKGNSKPCNEDEDRGCDTRDYSQQTDHKDASQGATNSKPFVFQAGTLNLSDRPIRAAAATAQAISEAQQEFLAIEPPPEFKRNRRGEIEVLVDKPVKPRKYCKKAKSAGQDLHAEKETADTTNIVYTDQMMMQDVAELVDTFRDQYLTMVETMHRPVFVRNVEHQLKKEKTRKDQLLKRVCQLESQIENLVQESLDMLKYSLKELGIEALSPPEFIKKAKEIVCNHNELQKMKSNLEHEISDLVKEQENIVQKKEQEMFERLVLMRGGNHVNFSDQDITKIIQKKIDFCIKYETFHNSENKSMDVTLTRVQGDLGDFGERFINPDDENNTNNNRGESKVNYHGPENDIYISDGVRNSHELADVNSNNINLWQRNQPTSTYYDLNNSGRDKFMNPIHFNVAIMDHINKEIEKSMRTSETSSPAPPVHVAQWSAASSQHSAAPSSNILSSRKEAAGPQPGIFVLPQIDSVSRMAQVIEDSLRGSQDDPKPVLKTTKDTKTVKGKSNNAVNSQDMEGLASRLETCVSKDMKRMTAAEKVTDVPQVRGSSKRKHEDEAARSAGGDEALQWQQQLSTGFDRLVALASQVDRRRLSSSESPQRREASHSQPAGTSAGSGDKLPERHFKKKYFDQQIQKRQQQNP